MLAKVFLDSNVLLYANDEKQSEKSSKATTWLRAIIRRKQGCLNLQVLNEVTNVMLKKRRDLDAEIIFRRVDALRRFGETAVTPETVERARLIRFQTSYSWWDCILLASALELDCTHFLSEDMQDGQTIEGSGGKGLTIVDPFAHSPANFVF